MSWDVSSRNVFHEDYDCVLRLPDLVRKCTWHTGVRHSVPSCSAFNGTDPPSPLSVFTITKRCRVACNGARCAYDETSMHKAGKEAKGERKMLG